MPRFQQPLAALAALLVVGAVVLPVRDGVLVRALDARVLVVIGIASYSLYLWHYPIVFSLGRHLDAGPVGVVLASVVVCIPVALASYALVERPFLGQRRRWGSTAATPTPEKPTEPVAAVTVSGAASVPPTHPRSAPPATG